MAAFKDDASRGTSTLPSGRILSATPRRRLLGMSGGAGGMRRLYRSGLRPSRISRTSRWPSVVSNPTLAPFLSSKALVATVAPWTMRSVCLNRPGRSVFRRSASLSRPAITPMD